MPARDRGSVASRSSLAALAVACSLGQAVLAQQVLHDEGVSGDLASTRLNPTDLGQIGPGTWRLTASQATTDRDYFTLRVAPGSRLEELRYVAYSGVDETAFLAVQSGTQFTQPANGTDPGELLGYTHYGPGRGPIGQDLLPLIANGFGAVGFTPPLPDGFYVFWLNQTGQVSTATLTFVVRGCLVDLNGDGVVDNGDIGAFVSLFLAGDLATDFNGDGVLDNGDILSFVGLFLQGC